MATVGPTNVPAFFNTDADFRTWGSTISAALATLGLVQTADTGQINWTTVTKPGGINTYQGYEVWRFNDSLQSGTPIYFKIEYGSGSAAADPSIAITVGSGSTGAGAVNGQLGSRKTFAPNTSKSAGVTLPFYISGDSGELLMAINVDVASVQYGYIIAIERPKDNANTRTNEGAFFSGGSMLAGANCQYIPPSGSVPTNTTGNWCAVNPGFWARSAAGQNADISPVFIPLGGVWRFSHLLVTVPADFAAGGTITPTILGGLHTYMAFAQTTIGTSGFVQGLVGGVAMLWE